MTPGSRDKYAAQVYFMSSIFMHVFPAASGSAAVAEETLLASLCRKKQCNLNLTLCVTVMVEAGIAQ
jgi:hypothetical protein